MQDQLDIYPYSVDVATDHFGGAYVVWENAQGIYTFQRIDSQSNPLWEESRVSLESSYYRVRVTSYSNGDALLVWGESSSTYAQRYTPEGTPVWTGPSYIPETSGPSDVSVNVDEQAVIVWRDYDLNYIYALKIDGDGNKEGPARRVNGNFYYDYSLDDPGVSVNSDGSAFVTWGDYQSGQRDIHMQHLNAAGNRVWIDDLNVNLNAVSGYHEYPRVISLQDDSAFVAWLDKSTSCVRGQRIDQAGNLHWDTAGICISDEASSVPSIPDISYGGGNIFVTWWGYQDSIAARFVQQVDISGQKLWSRDKRVDSHESSTPAVDYWGPLIAVDHSSVPIVFWLEPIFDSYDLTYDLHANSLDGIGDRRWAVDARIDTPKGVVAQQMPDLSISETDVIISVWQDYRLPETAIYAQRFDVNGNRSWNQDIKVSKTILAAQSQPYVATNDEGQAYVLWSIEQGEFEGTYLQLLDQWGNRLWAEDVFVTTSPGGRVALFADGSAGVAWISEEAADVYMQRYDEHGNPSWAQPVTTNAQYNGKNGSNYFELTSMTYDAIAIVWEHEITEDYYNLYTQIIDSDGTKSWSSEKRINRTSIYGPEKRGLGLASDSAGHLVVVWGGDARNANYHGDIYAQRLNASGVQQWENDVRVNSDYETSSWLKQNSPRVALDTQGNALIIWGHSYIVGGDLYTQRLSPLGEKMLISDIKLADCGARRRYEFNFGIGMDWLTSNELVIVWEDLKNDNSDINAQRITKQGGVICVTGHSI